MEPDRLPDELELREYLRRLWRERWLILAFLTASVGVTAVLVLLWPREYEAKTALLIMPRISEQLNPSAQLQIDESGFVQLKREANVTGLFSPETYQRLALAHDLLQELIRHLDLRENPEDPVSPPLSVEALKRHLRAEAVAAGPPSASGFRAPLLTLAARGTDPERISRIANTWSELVAQRHAEILTAGAAQSYDFISAQLTEARNQLQQKQADARQHLQQASIEWLTRALETLQGQYERLRAMLEERRLELALNPQEAGERRALERAIAYLEQRLEALEHDLKEKSVQLAEARAALEQQDREIRVLTDTVAHLSQRLEDARIAKAESSDPVRVVERAIPPQEPVGPRRWLFLALAVIVGGLLGILTASFKEYMTRPTQAQPRHTQEP